jgi:succinate dehydrogenase / fumarate reductase cytochrome b subunit
MLTERGREGYWAWLLHRVSGVGVVLFLFLHVLDTSLVGLGPAAYDAFVSLYRHPVFRALEVGLVAAVLYHGLNGLRIVAVDFVAGATRLQRQLWYVVWALFLALFLPSAFLILRPVVAPLVAGFAR